MGGGGRNGDDEGHHPAVTPFLDVWGVSLAGDSKLSITGLRFSWGKPGIHKTLPQTPKYWDPPPKWDSCGATSVLAE